MITDVQIMMFLVCIVNIIFTIYISWKRKEIFYIVISLLTIPLFLEIVIENWDAEIVRAKMELRDIALMSALSLVSFKIYKL